MDLIIKKYQRRCAVRGCATRKNGEDKIPIHRFPRRGVDIWLHWVRTCKNADLSTFDLTTISNKHFFICHRHFDASDFYAKRNGQLLLKPGTIPTLNLPVNNDENQAEVNIDLPKLSPESYEAHVKNLNIVQSSMSSPSVGKISAAKCEKPEENLHSFQESSLRFRQVFNLKIMEVKDSESVSKHMDTVTENIVSDDEDLQLDFQEDFSEELNGFPHVTQFIRQCQDRMKRQNKKIKKLRNKLLVLKQQDSESKKTFVDSETQTSPWDENHLPLRDWNTNAEGGTGSIVDQVKEAAESAVQQTGFVYEETSGLYYDYNTGYYYDAKLGLYYDGNLGRYYYYDEESKSYKFHSQSHVETSAVQEKKVKRKLKRKYLKEIEDEPKERKLEREDDNFNELEEGEYSDNSSQSSQDLSSDTSLNNESDNENNKDLAKVYPPCMRIVVKETNLPKLKLGTLFFIPYTGGSIGREGSHSVLIPDINISKHHARFQYDEEKKQYEIIDLGSRNGTILNNKRLSVAKQESDPHEVMHGSVIQVGTTKLLCHIHSGYETCGNCEPGLLQNTTSIEEETSISKKKQHKSELRRLKTKFGVESNNDNVASQVAEGYCDRALTRRICVGSSDDYSKTQQSSLDTSIAKDNKGFKLLTKMGWSEGKSLGKDGEGRTEPLPLVQNPKKSGLGFANKDLIHCEVDSGTEKKQALWRKTQQRYNDIPN